MLRITRATVARKPVTGESTKETVKPLRREGRTASAEPVCSCAFSSSAFAHEIAGAACTRSSLRPHYFGRKNFAKLGRSVPRECGCTSNHGRHGRACPGHPRLTSRSYQRGRPNPGLLQRWFELSTRAANV